MKTRENLKQLMYEEYVDKPYAVIIFYYTNDKDSKSGIGFEQCVIGANKTKDEFFERLREIEEKQEFIAFVGEDHEVQKIIDDFINAPENKELIEERKKIYGIR